MTVKQRDYVEGFKEQALAKVLGRSQDQSVRSIAADLGMNMGTLRGWMKQALRDGKSPVGGPHPFRWTVSNLSFRPLIPIYRIPQRSLPPRAAEAPMVFSSRRSLRSDRV